MSEAYMHDSQSENLISDYTLNISPACREVQFQYDVIKLVVIVNVALVLNGVSCA